MPVDHHARPPVALVPRGHQVRGPGPELAAVGRACGAGAPPLLIAGGEGGVHQLHQRGAHVGPVDEQVPHPAQRRLGLAVLAGDRDALDAMLVPRPNSTSSSRRRSTSLDRFSRVATEANSAMKSVSNSAYFRMSSRSMVPQRRSISALMATRDSGSSCFPRGETRIHGSPCFLTIATPVVPSSRACSKRSSDVRSLPWRAVMNDRRPVAGPGPRSGRPGCPRSRRAGRPPGCATGSRPPPKSPADAARPSTTPARTARTGCARPGPCRPPPPPATARAPPRPAAPSPPGRRTRPAGANRSCGEEPWSVRVSAAAFVSRERAGAGRTWGLFRRAEGWS